MLPVKCPFYQDFIDQWMGTNKFMLVLCPREHATTIKAKWFNKSFVKNVENYFIHMLISPHHLQQVEDRDTNWEIIFGPCTPLGKIKKKKYSVHKTKAIKNCFDLNMLHVCFVVVLNCWDIQDSPIYFVPQIPAVMWWHNTKNVVKKCVKKCV